MQVLMVRKEMTERLTRLKESPLAEPPTTGSLHAHFSFDNSVVAGLMRYWIDALFCFFSLDFAN